MDGAGVFPGRPEIKAALGLRDKSVEYGDSIRECSTAFGPEGNELTLHDLHYTPFQ